jgi:lysophospholipase L1-like esterase
MRYLALGDSISIDEYTGVRGGGAASQFAVRIDARGDDFQNLTSNGNLTEVVLEELDDVTIAPEVVTLTIGGNDLALLQHPAADILPRIAAIAARLAELRCRVIFNTVYDPTDGDDSVGEASGFLPSIRDDYNELNAGIKAIAAEHGFLLADLEALFHGHGIQAADTWFVQVIEPNLAGATAIAGEWHRLLTAA